MDERRWPVHMRWEATRMGELIKDSPTRKVAWVCAESAPERAAAIRQAHAAGWTVMGGLPKYYVVATRPDVTLAELTLLWEMISPSTPSDAVAWLGDMLGYSHEDIAWYVAAMERVPC